VLVFLGPAQEQETASDLIFRVATARSKLTKICGVNSIIGIDDYDVLVMGNRIRTKKG